MIDAYTLRWTDIASNRSRTQPDPAVAISITHGGKLPYTSPIGVNVCRKELPQISTVPIDAHRSDMTKAANTTVRDWDQYCYGVSVGPGFCLLPLTRRSSLFPGAYVRYGFGLAITISPCAQSRPIFRA